MTKFPVRFIASAMIAGLALPALAKPIDPQEALATASEFMTAPPAAVRKSAPAKKGELSIAYTGYSKDGMCGLYVVNSDNGYVVVTADDGLPQIAGFSDGGKFDPNNIPTNMQWWLEEYANQVAHFTAIHPNAPKRAPHRAPSRQEIAPMADFLWDQTAPYNDQCPIDSRTGRRSVTGCVATAMSIIMKYHNYPPAAKGSNGSYVFEGQKFDWDNMLPRYETGKYDKTQSEAVAKLMHLAGEAVDMMYSSQESGAYSHNVGRAMMENFDYNPAMKFYWKDYVRQMEWNNIIYDELSAKRPVFYAGRSNRGGHAFVCDGYLANEYYHFNWGWGGYQNGYFLLYLLNPEAGGTGSYDGGYNIGQTILTGIEPNNGQKGKQSALISTGAISYNQSANNWTIVNDPNGDNIVYNPLYNTQSLTVLQRVVKKSDDSVVGDYTIESASLPFGYGFTKFKNTLPANIPDGEYKVSIMFKSGNSEVQPILIPLGMQNYVTLTVKGGKYSYENQGVDNNEAPNLVFGRPIPAGLLTTSDNKSFRLTVSNTGLGDYRGNIGLTLYKPDDEMGTFLSANTSLALPGKSSTNILLQSSETIDPGRYICQILDEEDLYTSETYWFDVVESESHLDQPATFAVADVTPAFYAIGEKRAISFTATNPESFKAVTGTIEAVIRRASDDAKVWGQELGTIELPGSYNNRINAPAMSFDLTPGKYYWEIYVNSVLASERAPMSVWSEPRISAEGLYYVVTDEAAKTAIVCAPISGQYSGNKTITPTVDGYKVTSVMADAFTFATGLQNVAITANLPEIESGTFYSATNLQSVDLSGAPLNAPTLHEKVFNPNTQSSILLTVPKGMPNVFGQQENWTALKFGAWDITLDNGIKIESGLEINPATSAFFNPYYTNPLEALSFIASAPAGKFVKWEYSYGDVTGGSITNATKDLVWLPALHGNQGSVTLSISDVDAVTDVNADAQLGDIYNAQGILVKRHASKADISTLPAGIYIHAGKKVIVK